MPKLVNIEYDYNKRRYLYRYTDISPEEIEWLSDSIHSCNLELPPDEIPFDGTRIHYHVTWAVSGGYDEIVARLTQRRESATISAAPQDERRSSTMDNELFGTDPEQIADMAADGKSVDEIVDTLFDRDSLQRAVVSVLEDALSDLVSEIMSAASNHDFNEVEDLADRARNISSALE